MEKKPLTEFNRHVNILFPTGLMAIVLILLQALISTSNLNIPQFISMLIFSISIPLLALEIVARRYQQMIGYSPVSKLNTWTGYIVRINYFLIIAGVAACLGGARLLFAILFVLSSLIALLFISFYQKQIINIKEEEVKIHDD